MSVTDPAPVGDLSTPGRRIRELDVLRGLALCGILAVNVWQQLIVVRGGALALYPPLLELGFLDRFLSMFALLFGIGFALFLERAATRSPRPRVVLARRLGVLLVFGVIHQLFHPGEALALYAVVGLVVLLPMSLLPRPACLGVALVLAVVAPSVQVGYGVAVAALALGFAAGRYGVAARLGDRSRIVAAVGAVSGALTVASWAAATAGVSLPRVSVVHLGLGGDLVAALAALAGAVFYGCVVLLVLRTAAGRVVDAVLAPMGRMALTNYLTATALFLLLGPLLGIDAPDDGAAVAGLSAGLLVVQAIWSRWWLRRFAYGPLEWVWRCATWGRRAPLRRADAATVGP